MSIADGNRGAQDGLSASEGRPYDDGNGRGSQDAEDSHFDRARGRSIGWRRFANNRASRSATSRGSWESAHRPLAIKRRK